MPFTRKYTLGEMKSIYLTKYLQSWTKDCRQFTELIKICFSMEYFTADFSQFVNINVKIYLSGVRLGACHQVKACQGFF